MDPNENKSNNSPSSSSSSRPLPPLPAEAREQLDPLSDTQREQEEERRFQSDLARAMRMSLETGAAEEEARKQAARRRATTAGMVVATTAATATSEAASVGAQRRSLGATQQPHGRRKLSGRYIVPLQSFFLSPLGTGLWREKYRGSEKKNQL